MKIWFGMESAEAEAVMARLEGAAAVRAECPAEAEVLVEGRVTPERIAEMPSLRAVIVPWAGLTPGTSAALAPRPDIALYTLHGNAAANAEMALAHLFACARALPMMTSQMRSGDWASRSLEAEHQIKLEGRIACVLGFGEIGRRIARFCLALGMEVRAVRRTTGRETVEGIEVCGPEGLREAAAGAHVLMCAVPGTPETAGIVDLALLEGLAEDPIVVNNGRGPVIDEAALAGLVRSGRIRRIGLDVWWRYPRDGEEPFWGGSREMIESAEFGSFSPHAGSHVAGGEEERAAWLAAALRDLAEGREPSGRSDALRGY